MVLPDRGWVNHSPASLNGPRWSSSYGRSFGLAIAACLAVAAALPAQEGVRERAAAAGFRSFEGRHVTIITDLPASPELESLPQVFDLAAPQWAEYFDIPEQKVRTWRVVGFLIGDKQRFQSSGLLPADLPPFLHGYSRGDQLWLYDQPSDYYRRHLLLHEGVHSFMQTFLGGAGPPWYMEGMAELLATHRWQDGKLQVNYFPQSRDETPYWGRIKIVQDAFSAERGLTLPDVFRLDKRAHLQNEPYGWCWAAAAFLDGHPRYRERFRALKNRAADASDAFSSRFAAELRADARELAEEWQLFVAELDYGYDLARSAILRTPAQGSSGDLSGNGVTVRIDAARGWQSSGVAVEAGKRYDIAASGRYQVGDSPKPWICEPTGVTIEYWRGRPLGMLLGAVAPADERDSELTPLVKDSAVGAHAEWTCTDSGTLYFRVNEASSGLKDNRGQVTVVIRRVDDKLE